MATRGSYTTWLAKLDSDQELALEMLRRRLWPFLLHLARRRLGDMPRGVADEEDVAQLAFWGFVKSFRKGKVPTLENRKHLFAVVVLITDRKAKHLIQWHRRKKRAVTRQKGESEIAAHAGSSSCSAPGMAGVASHEPTPDEKVLAGDTVDHFVNLLPLELRPTAKLWLANYSHREIAAELNIPRSTVDSWLRRITKLWQAAAQESLGGDD
jgi:RNA polymerase sigma factor (sigma-70 family)